MDEYIKREAALDIVKRTSGDYATAWAEISRLPTEDVEPVVHGHWILTDKWASKAQYKCSVCSRRMMGSLDANKVIGKYPYCHCGAKMCGGEKGCG